jgi:hypothetical protein
MESGFSFMSIVVPHLRDRKQVRSRTATAQRKHIEQLLVTGTVTLLAVQLLQ